MAVVTVVTAGNVRLIFPQCDVVVVARYTGANDLRMIDKIRRRPHYVVMAVLADIAGQDVVKGLAACVRPVVTTDAVTGDIRMIKSCRGPCVCRVAVITVVAAGNVRLILA